MTAALGPLALPVNQAGQACFLHSQKSKPRTLLLTLAVLPVWQPQPESMRHRPVQAQGRCWPKRRLRHEARCPATMLLRRVDQERVAQIHGARFARGEDDFPLRPHAAELQMSHPGLSSRGQQARHVEMRADADACWRVVFANIRKQEQHKQRAVPRRDVDAPCRVVATLGIAGLARKAEINMPSEVARVGRGREAHDEGADAGAAFPTPAPHQRVEGVM